jgi:hypothetical protein
MTLQVVGSSYQSAQNPDLYMCLKCHYLETASGNPTPALEPFKFIEPQPQHAIVPWDETSDLLSTQGSFDGSLEDDFQYGLSHPIPDLSPVGPPPPPPPAPPPLHARTLPWNWPPSEVYPGEIWR